MTDQITAGCSQQWFLNQDLTVTDQNPAPQQPASHAASSPPKWTCSSPGDPNPTVPEDGLSNGTCEAEALAALRHSGHGERVAAGGERLAVSNNGVSAFPENDLSLPEVCVSTNRDGFEDDMNYEVQQAYKIFTTILLDKHKAITSQFLHPIGHHDAQHGIGGVQGRVHSQLRQSMCLQRIKEKFVNQEFETITEFVADFRLMLENCYRYHGVDHWISKQAQKLETMLEQKLTLLSRTLREKTTLAVTSKGRFGTEEERSSGGTSTRRRPPSRNHPILIGHESIMVQKLRLEEQQRAKEEKRQRELEKKEAEEISAKEVEEWEQSLLSQAFPQRVDTMWELPAIGHFLCLAQTALSLPEIVFFELERCLLMPRCSLLLSKIMSSLLFPPQRRAALHRRSALPYRRWESELRQRVVGWYRTVGASREQPRRAEQLGLCHQFFSILGEVSPLEEKPFHLLPFYQRVWLLKGLCDHVYETQKDVQDAVLAQPIHECRESILGYDSKENAYIHFPHFCGADLRIYCQSPSTPPAFPFPSALVKRVEAEQGTEGEESDVIKSEADKTEIVCDGALMDTAECGDFGKRPTETFGAFRKEKGNGEEDKQRFQLWSPMKEVPKSGSSYGNSSENSKLDAKLHTDSLFLTNSQVSGVDDVKQEISSVEQQSKQKRVFSLGSERTIKAETQDPCLSVGEHSYTGRSPASSVNLESPTKPADVKAEDSSPSPSQTSPCLDCRSKTGQAKTTRGDYCCGASGLATQLSSESAQNSSEERLSDKIWTKKKKRKKKHKHPQRADRARLPRDEDAMSALRKVALTIKRTDKKKRHKTGKKTETLRKTKDEAPPATSFKLVCSNLDELRELISKTEDELDELESMKKKLGRWYYRKEAVKELHSTLIRLLNELLPWEPKLAKAYQRNRLRLKKEFDDFKKHPEYNNFEREECVSSSSSDEDYDYEEGGLEKDGCGELEEDDQEHVPRGLWSGASTREFGAEPAAEESVTCATPNHLKHTLPSKEKGVALLSRVQAVGTNITSAESRGELQSELILANQSKDSGWATGMPTHNSLSPTYPTPNPTCGLPKGYTPIPTLLAKSVGNKVTLMKRPSDFPGLSSVGGQRKGSLVPLPTSAATNLKVSKAQSFPFGYQQNSQQKPTQTPQQTQVHKQPALPKTPQAKSCQAEPKSAIQVVYKAPEGLGHLVRKDSSSPIRMSVHSVVDQNTAAKVMQQVVFLPSNLLIQKTETKTTDVNPKQSKDIQVPVSKVATPVCISTDVPGFSIPESKIPVQQLDLIKDTRTGKSPTFSFPPHLQRGPLNASGCKETQICSIQTSTPKGSMMTPLSITTLSRAVSTESITFTEPKQELKTVCIRDSQSILVTTRGGNTGIVKVQTSSDQNSLGSFPTSPVITISPQLKAFLVSKTSTLSSSAASQTSPSTVPAVPSISAAQTQKQAPKFSNSTLTTATSSIPVTGPERQTTGTSVALSQGSSFSTAETKMPQRVHTASSGSAFPASALKNVVAVPSPSSSGVSPVLTQEFLSKTGVKRTSTDGRAHVTKYILVAPSSSNKATPKGTPSPPKSVTSSRVMVISQPTATSSTTFTGPLPKPAMATGNGHALNSSLTSQTLKMGLSSAQPVCSVSSEALSKTSNNTLPSGIAIPLIGKTTSVGQTIGALSQSPSTTIPVSVIGSSFPTAASTTGLVPYTTVITVTTYSTQVDTRSSLTTSSPLHGTPSVSVISQTSCSRSAAPTSLPGNVNKKDFGILAGASSNSSPAEVTVATGGSPAQMQIPTLNPKPLYIKGSVHEENTSLLSSSQLAGNKTQTTFSSAPTTCTPFTTSTTGTVQQRIIINTSTHLTAGTQIFLNNARFVVPPQGLGPGSHVLIISSPAPQVPTTTPASIRPSVAPKGASPTIVMPRAPVLPQSTARLPGVPAVSSPFVACTPAVGPSLMGSTPHVIPFRLTGTPGVGSTLIPSKTNVVPALPRFPSGHAGNFGLPPVSTPTLVSSPPSLGGVPAIVSPVITSAPALGSAPATIRVAAGTASQAKSSSIFSSAISTALPKLSGALSSLPGLPSSSAGALCSPVLPVSVAPSPAAALCSYLPSQQVVGVTTLGHSIQPEQTEVKVAAPSTVHPQGLVQTGPGNTVLKEQMPMLSGTGTRVLPTVTAPPIISAASRMQALPIATVPPVGSTVSTFEMAHVAAAPPTSTTVTTSSDQPIPSLTTNSTIHPPVILTNTALGKDSAQTSALGTHASVPSKLLISPDGAVLSTVQCRANPAELTACPNPLDALVGSSNSPSGALKTHDSTLQPLQADGVNHQNNTEPAT
ncbi:uncharacterized protein KIAA2026 [Kryptolebias marmoratus]|uniref:Bromodomain containing 10 n=1 Tax=Kryptolebias marmoratus TaxID=37003 RepID=A0A3Q3B2J1_KRYMA|nr:uncharacterized protein KIAA2026 [Kryptolebias marmoratus]